jgi:acetyl esterase/lipase
MVRSNAERYAIDPNRIGILGFSAGGHLASTAGTHFDKGNAEAKDPIDRVSCRPDFMVLIYPVISLSEPFAHTGSGKNLLGDNPDPKLLDYLSNEKQVTPETPPTFLVHTYEDKVVPAENSIYFYLALRKANVPAEMHLYQKGPHGFGLGKTVGAASSWPIRCAEWMQASGLLDKKSN